MRVIALEYHDVVPAGGFEDSGFPGRAAATYKMLDTDFAAHLRELDGFGQERRRLAGAVSPTTVVDGDPPLMLTFDDGGAGARLAADVLERHGWRGHFLIATDYIGTRTFLGAPELRELHGRGHIIGSHSCSHPLRMSSCPWPALLREWSESVRMLSDILGAPVRVASVPGGGYSRDVARAAAAAGLRTLFTSEPVTRTNVIDGCAIVGRFTLRRDSPPVLARRYAAGSRRARLTSWAAWNAKKLAKAAGGSAYLKARGWLLDGR